MALPVVSGVQHGWVQRLDHHRRCKDNQKHGKCQEQLDGVREGQTWRERAVLGHDGESDDEENDDVLEERLECTQSSQFMYPLSAFSNLGLEFSFSVLVVEEEPWPSVSGGRRLSKEKNRYCCTVL